MVRRDDGQAMKRMLRPLVRRIRNTLWGVVVGYDSSDRLAVLTFDDGPSRSTCSLLDVLDEYEVRATFFMQGKSVERFPELAAEVAKRGHVIGNHAYQHVRLVGLSFGDVIRQVGQGSESILTATGVRSHLFRPPYGQFDIVSYIAVRLMGYRPVLWSVAGVDWREAEAGEIVDRVLAGIRPGGIILLHDGAPCSANGKISDRERTVRATRVLLETLLFQGYRFTTIPDMIRSGQVEIRCPFRWAAR